MRENPERELQDRVCLSEGKVVVQVPSQGWGEELRGVCSKMLCRDSCLDVFKVILSFRQVNIHHTR